MSDPKTDTPEKLTTTLSDKAQQVADSAPRESEMAPETGIARSRALDVHDARQIRARKPNTRVDFHLKRRELGSSLDSRKEARENRQEKKGSTRHRRLLLPDGFPGLVDGVGRILCYGTIITIRHPLRTPCRPTP